MKKQLLKESEVRKLMKFANIGALTDGFVSRITEADMMGAEDEEEAGAGMTSPEAPMSMDADAEPEPEQSLEDPEMLDDEMPEEGADGEVGPAVAQFVEDMDVFLNKVAGTPRGTVTSDQEGAPDMADAGAPVDEPVDVASADASPGEEAAEDEEEMPVGMAEGAHEEDEEKSVDEDMVNEVARRVARRLKKLRNK